MCIEGTQRVYVFAAEGDKVPPRPGDIKIRFTGQPGSAPAVSAGLAPPER